MKKRGFTLIELLAVILILGIIALITIPTISKIIKKSMEASFEVSANNLVRAIVETCTLEKMEGEPITAMYTFTDGIASSELDVTGDLPTSGTAIVDSNCKVALSVTDGTFTATKLDRNVIVVDGDEVVEIYNVYANGTAVYFNPVSGAKCTAGEAVSTTGTKTGCMKWYAFNDGGSSSDTINLILDHNTTAVVAWNSTGSNVSGPTDLLAKLQTDTSFWSGVPTRTDSYNVSNGTATYNINYGTYKARLITAEEIAMITGNSSFVETTADWDAWFYLDSTNQTQTATTTGASNYAWLFDYTSGCTSYGCNIADDSNTGYWTNTALAGYSNSAWFVYGRGNLNNYVVESDLNYGLRPVISLLKSNL